MWNDTDTPLAFLISFRTYGTWLHGDERGSIERHNNNYGSPKNSSNDHWKQITATRMKSATVKLDAAKRVAVEKAVRETCEKRNWNLLAINVRTNHVHTVVATGGRKPSSALNAFKANATRQMRADGCWCSESTRGLTKAASNGSGPKSMFRMQSHMYCLAKVTICRGLTKKPHPLPQVVLTRTSPATAALLTSRTCYRRWY